MSTKALWAGACGALGWVSARHSLDARLPFDRGGELLQVRTEGIEEAHDRMPPDPASPPLDLRDVGRMDAEPKGQLVLSHACLNTQRMERSPEHELILGGVTH